LHQGAEHGEHRLGTCVGSGTWRLVTHCWGTGSTSVPWAYQSGGTWTRYSSCPSWSHVTQVIVETQQ
jgi:hypothetical protein